MNFMWKSIVSRCNIGEIWCLIHCRGFDFNQNRYFSLASSKNHNVSHIYMQNIRKKQKKKFCVRSIKSHTWRKIMFLNGLLNFPTTWDVFSSLFFFKRTHCSLNGDGRKCSNCNKLWLPHYVENIHLKEEVLLRHLFSI